MDRNFTGPNTNQEDDIITEASNPVHCRHSDDKREQIVDEGVDELKL